jgi:nucleoside-diphosphate-sugar epimerase
MEVRSILITGGGGFIGRHLTERLRALGYRVVIHDSAEGDIARCALEYTNVGHVFHLAAEAMFPRAGRIHGRSMKRICWER